MTWVIWGSLEAVKVISKEPSARVTAEAPAGEGSDSATITESSFLQYVYFAL
uniref:Uncharacterized protein n=1 Tax=uncultured marine virus TaxID=186617 RepID=A0A0F7L671_9VIRU|nr:hypothetical protein [uncultured marine virus]